MDTEDLVTALTAHTPDTDDVLFKLRTKRTTQVRRRRRLAATAAAGVLACAAAAASVQTVTRHGSAGGATAGGCASVPVGEFFARARAQGGSVILGNVALTGRYTNPSHTGWAQLRLTGVRTIAGPASTSGSTVWTASPQHPDPGVGATLSHLWAPDGSVLAVVMPHLAGQDAPGPRIDMAPVAGGKVVFSAAGCWDSEGLPRTRFTGHLAEVPGSDTYTLTQRQGGFWAVPLPIVEHLAQP